MILEYDYNPEIILNNDLDVYFYGAGTGVSSYSRIGLAALKAMRKAPVAFIDDNFLDSSNELFGIPVLTPYEAKKKIETNERNYIIIITSNYFETIIESVINFELAHKVYNLSPFKDKLTKSSCANLISFSDAIRKLEGHYSKSKQFERKSKSKNQRGINLAFLDIQLTERCTMKCKDCSNLMQYYEKPIHADHDDLMISLNNLLGSIDSLSRRRNWILGLYKYRHIARFVGQFGCLLDLV